jgi:hypothetical protein
MANNKETKKEETGLVVEIEALLTPAKLKEIASQGEDGQFIKLVDIDHTKQLLTDLATKYKDLKITKDNWKQEGVEGEKELRQTRYALQRIYKSNNAFLNDVKKSEKQTYDDLINVIEPHEKRVYDEVNAFKEIAKKEKEEADRKEKERVEGIEKALKETEFALEKAVIQGKTQEDLIKYDEFLEDLKNRFADFEEMEFQAKRLHAIYTAKREKLKEQVTNQEALVKQMQENAEKEAKREEQKGKIYELRKDKLLKKGLEFTHLNTFDGYGVNITNEDVKQKDEIEWYEFLETLDEKIQKQKEEQEAKEKQEQEAKDKAEKDALIKARKDWDDLVTIYEGLGGDPKVWKLKKDEIPSTGDIERLTKATRDLQIQKKTLKLKAVKDDIEPFKNNTLQFLKLIDETITATTFKNAESKSILENFKERTLEVVNEVFGEVYNK